jgi:GWxTD domain-containing protein
MLIAAVITAATLASHSVAQVGASGIEMRATRFWVPEVKKTSVLAMIDVPYALATPVGTGPAAYIAYTVSVALTDADGKVLQKVAWNRHAAAALRAESASGMEQVNFAMPSGDYQMVVNVTDSATGKLVADSLKVAGYGRSPEASDLLLANRIRPVPTSDTSVDVGEVARGNYRFVTAPVLHVDPTDPTIGFLLEVYTPDSATATLALSIATAGGADVIPLMPAQRKIPAGGGVIANQFSVEGLPAGDYLVKAALTINGQKVERQAPFTMNSTEVALARTVTETNANRGLDAVYFNGLPEDSLDAAAEELQIFPGATKRDLAPYKRDELSLTAKRNFLIQFWAQHDANKSTPENETRMAFYQAVGYANAHYSVRYTPGWKTARGRIVTKFGLPDDSLTNPMAGQGIRYLVWRYTNGKDRWFIFGDRDNNGNFIVMHSNEPTEPGTPDWLEQITPASSEDIAQWLGYSRAYFTNSGG